MKSKDIISNLSLTLISALFIVGTNSANANEEYILTPEDAARLGVDFQKAKLALSEAGIDVLNDSIGIRFHEESSLVDLGNIDSVAVTVSLDDISQPACNSELGGHQ